MFCASQELKRITISSLFSKAKLQMQEDLGSGGTPTQGDDGRRCSMGARGVDGGGEPEASVLPMKRLSDAAEDAEATREGHQVEGKIVEHCRVGGAANLGQKRWVPRSALPGTTPRKQSQTEHSLPPDSWLVPSEQGWSRNLPQFPASSLPSFPFR